MHEIDTIFKYSWLAAAIPLASVALMTLVLRPFARRTVPLTATAAVFGAMVVSLLVAWKYFFSSVAGHEAFTAWAFEWLKYQPGLAVKLGVLLDPISVLLMVIVTTVSCLVHIYSLGYMKHEKGIERYFIYLNLFTFSMLGLVMAPNIIQMYMCWELVGASSFLLIGFYYQRPAAVAASNKAFIVTRFADLGFLLGIIILGYFGYQLFGEIGSSSGAGPFDFAYLTSPAVLEKLGQMPSGVFGASILTLGCILVFAGAAGKSAMFPLHIWLPDAMEGPTPVSALIHAATMVVAGVYLVARLFTAFAASGTALLVVAYVGAFTSIFAAIIAITQDDIKRVLAYSTLSQLGYMMLSLGGSTASALAGYGAAMFHLFTHAFFKALLFLAAGAVIHAVSTNNIRQMGGLRKKMPVTHITFLAATLAIAGIWPFAGFFSKDAMLASLLGAGHSWLFAFGVIVAGLTAAYMFRIYFIVFLGKGRDHCTEHAHEAPWIMLAPMALLALLSLTAGFVPVEKLVGLHGPEVHDNALMVAIIASAAAVAGIMLSFILYKSGSYEDSAPVPNAIQPAYRLVKNKFYIDEIYLALTRSVIFRLIAAPIAWFDRHVVDGAVNLSGWTACKGSAMLRQLQTGQVQSYGLWMAGGGLLVFLLLWAAMK